MLDDGAQGDGREDGSPAKNHRVSFAECPVVKVTMSWFTLTYINWCRNCIAQVDGELLAFISSFIIPRAINYMAPSQGERSPTAPSPVSRTSTPEMKGKVTRDRATDAWKLSLNKPRVADSLFDAGEDIILAESNLCSRGYSEARIQAYHRALTIWNAIDGSGRRRIQRH